MGTDIAPVNSICQNGMDQLCWVDFVPYFINSLRLRNLQLAFNGMDCFDGLDHRVGCH
jgi:hypothetical protein